MSQYQRDGNDGVVSRGMYIVGGFKHMATFDTHGAISVGKVGRQGKESGRFCTSQKKEASQPGAVVLELIRPPRCRVC